MSDRDISQYVDATGEGGLRAPPGLGPLGKLWWWFHFVVLVKLARLRFLAVLAAIGGVIAYWDTINAYYEKWTRPLLGAETAVSPESEYWCPMHPAIVRDHPDKCPICAMPLSKRKKGDKQEGEALPPGVVSRVQLTPYKVAVAGIETVEIGYQALTRDISAVGLVEFDERKLARITARATGKSRIDKLYVNVTGQHVEKDEPLAELYSPALVTTVEELRAARRVNDRRIEDLARERLRLWGIDDKQIDKIVQADKAITHLIIRSPIQGHIIKKYQVEGEYVEEGAQLYDVADLSTVWIEGQVYEDDLPFLKDAVDKKLPVTASTKAFPNRQFKGTILFVNPHLDAATRTLMVRFDIDNLQHELWPGMWATAQLQVPVTRLDLLPPDASAQQKQKYQRGQVLAVPERAVIDSGSHKFVYRETEPDVYEGVEVELGPRCGGFYPVARGLQAGDRVVTTGSFLIDAETRLTGGAASTYFGASGGPHNDHSSAKTAARPSMTRDEDSKVQAVLAKLSPEERRLAQEQGNCPVLGTRLGAMGVPVSVVLEGQKVLLCCKGCIKKAKANPKAMLAKVTELKARSKAGTPRTAPRPSPGMGAGGKLEANLAKLSTEDRRLVEEQKYCPIETDTLLGKMGPPVLIEVKGQRVFLCCEACRDEALENPDKTLAKVKELKGKAKKPE